MFSVIASPSTRICTSDCHQALAHKPTAAMSSASRQSWANMMLDVRSESVLDSRFGAGVVKEKDVFK